MNWFSLLWWLDIVSRATRFVRNLLRSILPARDLEDPMSVPSFTALEPSYVKLWNELVPSTTRLTGLHSSCSRMVTHKPAYEEASQNVWGTPDTWFIVAILDQMEGGGGAHTHLWNGDSLSAYTKQVPSGEPRVGHGPPFTFVESAVAALKYQGFDKVKSWTPAACGYWFEDWNGWGYLNKKGTNPYLCAWSNKETPGKYVADHVFDPNAMSGQPGALTLLKVLQQVDPTIKLGYTGTSVIVPATPPTQGIVPMAAVNLTAVEGVINMISPFIQLIPGAGPWVQIGLVVLKLTEALETAPDLQSKLAVLEAHLADITGLIGQAKQAVQGTPVGANTTPVVSSPVH